MGEEEFYLREHQKFAKNCFTFGEFCHFVSKGSKSVNQILICSKCRHHRLLQFRSKRLPLHLLKHQDRKQLEERKLQDFRLRELKLKKYMLRELKLKDYRLRE